MCVWMLTRVEQIVTDCTQRVVILHADLLMNPDHTTKTRLVWPTVLYRSKSPAEKSWAWIGIFKPAEPHSPWDACLYKDWEWWHSNSIYASNMIDITFASGSNSDPLVQFVASNKESEFYRICTRTFYRVGSQQSVNLQQLNILYSWFLHRAAKLAL